MQTKPQNFKPNFHWPLQNYKQAKPEPRLEQISKYFQASSHSLPHPPNISSLSVTEGFYDNVLAKRTVDLHNHEKWFWKSKAVYWSTLKIIEKEL